MDRDPLSDLLRSVRLRGAMYYYVSCGSDFVAQTPASAELADALMPGAEHVFACHLVLKGDGWAAADGVSPQRFTHGDIVMFPRGDPHLLSSAPGLEPVPDDSDWRLTTRDAPKPIDVAYVRGVLRPGTMDPVNEAQTIFLCGFLGCDLRPFNPLIESMPRLLHMPVSEVGAWVAPALSQAATESGRRRPGSEALLERVTEMVFVDAARRYLETLPENASGWLAALRDRWVGRAISLMHESPADEWTVEELGRRVGLSRSALHERFLQMVGHPPMQYLANWRIQLGAGMLREGNATVATIAQEVGYESEAAFSRAFKRLVGQPPAAWRRAQRA